MTEPEVSSLPPAPRPRWWQRYRRELIFIVLIIGGMHLLQTRHIPAGPAPSFIAPLAGGGQLSLQQWRAHHQGQPVAVYFWADWCPVCRAQQPNIEAVHQRWPLLSVAMQSGNADEVDALLQQRELSWTTVVDANGSLARSFGVHGVPALIVLDGEGNIRAASVGYTTRWAMYLRLWWAGLFAR